MKQTNDSLSRITSTTYDVMNRTTQINYPDGGQTNDSFDDGTPATTETKKVDNAGNVGRVNYIFDKLYRVTQKQTSDPAGTIFVDTQYDAKGRKSQVSNPYRSGDTEVWTTLTYDFLDRTSVKTNPDGSTVQYAYSNNQTTITDEAGNQRRYTYDHYDHLTQVDEPNPTLSSPLTTTYSTSNSGVLIITGGGGDCADLTRSQTISDPLNMLYSVISSTKCLCESDQTLP